MTPMKHAFHSIYLLAIMVVLGACAQSNPLARAETIEQKAFATYGTFVIFEEQAAKLVTSGVLPRSAIVRIGDADARAKDIADDLLAATLEFAEIRAEYLAGGGTGEERYISAMNNLNNWTERALPLINNLVSAVQGAKQ